jgi:hypothetical protein
MEQQVDVSTADKTLGEHHNSSVMVANRPRQMSMCRAPADDDGEGARKYGDYCGNNTMRLRAAPSGSVGVLENRGKKPSGATYTIGPASVTTAIMECHEPPIQLSCVDTESMSLHDVKRMANLIGPTTSLRYFTSDHSVPIVGTELYENGCFAVETGVCADEQQKHAFVAEQQQQQGQWRPQQVRAELRTATACAAAAGKDTCKKRMPIEVALYDRYRHHRVARARGRKNHVFALRALFLVLPLAAVWGTLAVEAAFTPRTRAELQGDGTAGGGGVFGCVGECGQSLKESSCYAYCNWDADGPWESGDGTPCVNADSDVPSGQGDGKYGAIGSWIVSKITNMYRSECTTVHPCVVFLMSPPSLSFPFLIPHTRLSSSSSSSLDVLSV